MAQLISEAIQPIAGSFDPSAMSRGEPGLPTGFTWRGRTLRVNSLRRAWKQLRLEASGGELYLRRHYYLLEMEDGTDWTVYCLRQPPPRSGGPRRPAQRWYLYSIG